MLSLKLPDSTRTLVRDHTLYATLNKHANLRVDEPWPELLTVLFQLSIADDSGKRESAFRVFNTTPGIIEKQHEDAVGQAFTKGFKDNEVGVCLDTISITQFKS